MKKTISAIIFLIFISLTSLAYAQPSIPVSFIGSVLDASGAYIGGETISIAVDGQTYSSVTSENGVYNIVVPFDEDQTSADEGLAIGDEVTFMFGNIILGTAIVETQGHNRVDLTIPENLPDSRVDSPYADNTGRNMLPEPVLYLDEDGEVDDNQSQEIIGQNISDPELINQQNNLNDSENNETENLNTNSQKLNSKGVNIWVIILIILVLIVVLVILFKFFIKR
jgi:hypothetical protein